MSDVVVISPDPGLAQLAQKIMGDRQQRRAGELIAFHSYHDAYATCMAERGEEYVTPAFVDIYAGWDDSETSELSPWLRPPGTGLDLVERIDLHVRATESERQDAETMRTLNVSGSYHAALAACDASGSITQENNFPTEALDAFAALDALLQERLSESAVSETAEQYGSCMAKAGFSEISSPDELVVQLREEAVASRPASADIVPVEIAEAENAANAADVACRSHNYQLVLDAVSSLAEDFEQGHAREVTAAEARWQEYVRRASDYPEWAMLGF